MQSISVVIFDCDGVMFDSRQANANFYNHILARFGLPPMDKEDLAYVHMHTSERSVQRIFRGSPHLEEAQAYRLQMDYSPYIRDMVMEPGLKEVLKALKPRFKLAVATNRTNTIEEVLRRHGLSSFFDMVVSSLDVQNAKPHPDPLLKILDFFETPPDRALYVGDSPVDSETAEAAGVPFASYRNEGMRADYRLSHLVELLDLLGLRTVKKPGERFSSTK